jgi:hypothetical protein
LNIYDLIYHEKLVLSKTAVEELTQLLDPNRREGEAAEAEAKPKAKKEAQPKAEEVRAEETAPETAAGTTTEEAADNE